MDAPLPLGVARSHGVRRQFKSVGVEFQVVQCCGVDVRAHRKHDAMRLPIAWCKTINVGEASNPGPPQLLRRYRGGVGRNVVPRIEASWRQTQVDTDDEVLPTAFDLTVDDSDEVGHTAPASSQALREARLQVEHMADAEIEVGETVPASSGALRNVRAQMVPHGHRMHEEEVLSTTPAAPSLAPSTLVTVQNRFAPLIAEGGRPSQRLVLVGVQEDDVARDLAPRLW